MNRTLDLQIMYLVYYCIVLTVCNGFILEISGDLNSPFWIRSSVSSCGIFAARQNSGTALEGWDIKSANIFNVILNFSLRSFFFNLNFDS